jgi:hypothetical protein
LAETGNSARWTTGLRTVDPGFIQLGAGNRLPPGSDRCPRRKEMNNMGYGIGGVLVLILVILAIIYFARRV